MLGLKLFILSKVNRKSFHVKTCMLIKILHQYLECPEDLTADYKSQTCTKSNLKVYTSFHTL